MLKKTKNPILVPSQFTRHVALAGKESKDIIDSNDQQELSLSPSVMEYLERMENRKIYLFGDIDQDNILNVILQIHLLESRCDDDIEILINSDGGYVVDCFALIDVMDSSPCDFKIVVLGIAASAACLIASNGTVGKRFVGRNAEIMFHEVMGDVPMLRRSDIPFIKEETERVQNKFNKIFSRNTGKPVSVISKYFYGRSQDRYMTPKEAIEFGVVDHIISRKKRDLPVQKKDIEID